MARSVVAGNRATLLYMLGETRRAEAAGVDALRRVQTLRADQPAIPGIAIRYATTLNRLGRAAEAIRILTEARQQSEALGNRYWIGQASYQLAMSHIASGRPEIARGLMEEARHIWTENPAANAEHLAELSRATAELALGERDLAEAKSHIDSSLEQFGYPARTSSPGCAAALITAVRIYLAAGENEKALTFATAAVRSTQAVARDLKESADVGEAQLVMAMTQKARGNRAEARLAAQRAVEALRNALGEKHALTRAALTFQRSVAT